MIFIKVVDFYDYKEDRIMLYRRTVHCLFTELSKGVWGIRVSQFSSIFIV